MNLITKLTAKTVTRLLLCALCAHSHAATLKVGPQHPIKRPSQAAALAKDGDTIEIEAGTYTQDVAAWQANNLTIKGINGLANLYSEGATFNGKGIWLIRGNNSVVENIGFNDAKSKDRNGAGIRLEGTNLTVKHCLFRNNENGILTGANAASEVVVENSEFDHNGHGDGKSHNLYIGAIKKFSLKDSRSRHAYIGHQVKSRAAENLIIGNKIEDGPTGQSSYLIDLPAGGIATIENNTLAQGPMAENSTMVSYGAEKMLYPLNDLTINNNVFTNQRRGPCILINIKKSLHQPAQVSDNQFSGCSQLNGPIQALNNTFQNQATQ